MTLDLESVEKEQLEEMLPDISFIDEFLQDILPQENVHALDLIEDVLKGDWVLNPKLHNFRTALHILSLHTKPLRLSPYPRFYVKTN